MKFLSLFFLLALFSPINQAKADATNEKVYKLLTRLKSVRLLSAPVLRFETSPKNPVQGQNISLIIHPDTNFTGLETSLDLSINGEEVNVERPSRNLWIYPLGTIEEEKSFLAQTKVFVENIQENIEIRDAIKLLDRDINRLTNQINNERDPVRRKILQQQREEKVALKNELLDQLKRFRTRVAEQEFAFAIKPAANSPYLPVILSINPKIGKTSGGTLVKITGERFKPDAKIFFSGSEASTTYISETQLEVISPALSEGAKDVELRQQGASGRQNHISLAAFFATNSAAAQNIKPVAVTTGFQMTSPQISVQLDGSQSYDVNEDSFSYAWHIVSAPEESGLQVGELFSTQASPAFTPNVEGTYVFELKVKELLTPERLESSPSLAIVLAKQGAVNLPPNPSASAISVLIGQAGTSQIFANDPDNNTHSFLISTSPIHGMASVSESGLVSYQADSNFVGQDSITVRVTDPANASAFVSIPITISTDNLAPVPTANAIFSNTEIAYSQISANDPNAGQSHNYTIITPPSQGTAQVDSQGLLSYDPNTGFTGTDAVTVLVSDNGLPSYSAEITVLVTVNPNTAPQLSAPAIVINQGEVGQSQAQLIDPDLGQSGTFFVSNAAHGTVNINQAGLITYTPQSGFAGNDSFFVSFGDTGDPSLSAQIAVEVFVNGAPIASANPIYSRTENTQTQITVNDPNPSQSHSFAILNASSLGTASIGANGLVSFSPNGSLGSDSITVRVSDSGGLYSDLLIPVQVEANRSPNPTAPVLNVASAAIGTLNLSANDPDMQQVHSYSIISAPTNGIASLNGAVLSYQSNASYAGADALQVRVTDNGNPALFADLNVSINVVANNQSPVVGNILFALRTGKVPFSVGLSVDANITDPDGSIVSRVWNFGDGTSESSNATDASILHNYVNPGTYTATLTVTDNLGASTVKSLMLNVVDTDIPTAKFSVDKISGPVPLTISFQAGASSDNDGIVVYRWRFGATAPEVATTNPVINRTFNTAGTYQVRLRTRDAFGAMGESFVLIYAGVSPPAQGTAPVASFDILPAREQLLGSVMNFAGSRSFDPNPSGALTNYVWNFNDFVTCPGAVSSGGGCTATGVNASYTYPSPTSYFPNLVVTGAGGANSPQSLQELILVLAGHAPRPVLSPTNFAGVAPFTLSVNASGSYDYDGTISAYTWNFGDYVSCIPNNCTVNGAMATHTYSTPGVYFLRLEVLDNDGNFPSRTQTITVNPSFQSLAKTLRALRNIADDPEREERKNLLAGSCASGAGYSCYELALLFEEEGDSYTASKLKERACSLGVQEACSQ